MDGRTLLRDLRMLLQEQSTSSWMDDKTSYDYLFKAAIEFVSRTGILTSSTTITTVANQSAYVLPHDFMHMYLRNQDNNHFVKYTSGTSEYFIEMRDYDPVVLSGSVTSVFVPSSFSIKDSTPYSLITGTCGFSAPDVIHPGEAELRVSTDTVVGAMANARPGDTVHNTSDGSDGIIITGPDNTRGSFQTAMFGGTDNLWTLGDTYAVMPQGRFEIYFYPAPSSSGNTVTVYYVSRPNPVYSDRRFYPIPIDYKQALLYYAAWMYKNRDRESNYAELELKYFEEQVKKACVQYGKTLHRKGFRVNYCKRANEDSSWR